MLKKGLRSHANSNFQLQPLKRNCIGTKSIAWISILEEKDSFERRNLITSGQFMFSKFNIPAKKKKKKKEKRKRKFTIYMSQNKNKTLVHTTYITIPSKRGHKSPQIVDINIYKL
jgi:hypothetical protein